MIETCEAEHHSIDTEATPCEMLQFLLDENGLSLSHLAAETGIKVSTLSGFLQGKQELNLRHVARLSARFRVEPGLFIERIPADVKA
ncbi:MAG: helix-turn-helix domain-containing protein [Planctomycetaceae bacterium]